MRERRSKKPRNPKRVFLVLCEGETEKEYVETLKRHFRIPVAIKTKVSGANINERLINTYVKELGVSGPQDYELFFIYDSDVESVVNKLMNFDGKLILTNPCVELWYLLHSRSHSRMQTSEEMVRLLRSSHTIWEKYSKGVLSFDQQKHLLDKYNDASDRARQLKWRDNPSSNFYEFIEALKEEAKKS